MELQRRKMVKSSQKLQKTIRANSDYNPRFSLNPRKIMQGLGITLAVALSLTGGIFIGLNMGGNSTTGVLPLSKGGTGVTDLSALKTSLGLSDLVAKSNIVDNLNSTDIDKPLSANQGNNLNNMVGSKMPLLYSNYDTYRDRYLKVESSRANSSVMADMYAYTANGARSAQLRYKGGLAVYADRSFGNANTEIDTFTYCTGGAIDNKQIGYIYVHTNADSVGRGFSIYGDSSFTITSLGSAPPYCPGSWNPLQNPTLNYPVPSAG
jgi:hypothetical protein